MGHAGIGRDMSRAALEQKLARSFSYEYAVMAGRARSALVALIEILRKGENIPVLLPENICPVLVTAIRAGGGTAVTVPVSPLSGLPDDQAFVEAMNNQPTAGIVMPTHLYGFLGDYSQTVKFARAKGWFILENDTNAVRYDGDAPFGDGLLMSFGYAKPLEVGRGGAIMTNEANLAKEIQSRLSTYGPLYEATIRQENDLMLKRRGMRQNLDVADPELMRICDRETTLSRFRFDERDCDLIRAKLNHFPTERQDRLARKEIWDRALEPLDNILRPVPLPQPVPWRLIRRAVTGRAPFTDILWQNDIDAGINYRSLWREMPAEYLNGTAPASDLWGETVLNLWVTKDYHRPRIEKAADLLMKAAHDQ